MKRTVVLIPFILFVSSCMPSEKAKVEETAVTDIGQVSDSTEVIPTSTTEMTPTSSAMSTPTPLPTATSTPTITPTPLAGIGKIAFAANPALERSDQLSALEGVYLIQGIGNSPEIIFDPSVMEEKYQQIGVSVSHLAWSPDGSKLLMNIRHFGNGDDWFCEWFIYELQANALRSIFPEEQFLKRYSSLWSPDSKKILFWGDHSDSEGMITSYLYLYDIETNTTTTLMEIAGSITNVGWSQDSKSIYYDVRDYDKSNIYIINLSTSPSPILNNEYYDLVLGEIEENALLVYSDRYPQGFLIVNLDGSVERGFEMDTMPQSYPAIQDIQIIPNSNGDFTYSECERSLQYFTCSIYMNNIYVPGRKDLITLPGEYIWKENLFRYRFSKDNEKLIIEHAKFLSQEFWDQGPIKLSVLDLTSGELITITNTEESMDYWADWLPDERHLIYVHLNLLDYTQENLTLRLSLSDGSEALDITDNYDSLIYAWSE